MKAVHVVNTVLQDVDLPRPEALARDLIVKVEAISVNPIDTKIRKATGADAPARVIGWDVAGTVVEVGSDASLFKVGDPVWYAGSLVRAGANSEFHAVDERIVGHKPASLGMEQAAALPLTTITAWEALFERLGIDRNGAHANRRILVIGGAGGVGSIAIQLASKLAKLEVIATASRQESADWCRDLGATHVIDHTGDLNAQLKALNIAAVDYVLCLNSTDLHMPAMVEAIAPQGKICSIVEAKQPVNVDTLFRKSATLVFELMFTRSMFGTPDMIEQHNLLSEVARLIDDGTLRTTVNEVAGSINAANLTRAHAALEGGRTIGKIVLAGFEG